MYTCIVFNHNSPCAYTIHHAHICSYIQYMFVFLVIMYPSVCICLRKYVCMFIYIPLNQLICVYILLVKVTVGKGLLFYDIYTMCLHTYVFCNRVNIYTYLLYYYILYCSMLQTWLPCLANISQKDPAFHGTDPFPSIGNCTYQLDASHFAIDCVIFFAMLCLFTQC